MKILINNNIYQNKYKNQKRGRNFSGNLSTDSFSFASKSENSNKPLFFQNLWGILISFFKHDDNVQESCKNAVNNETETFDISDKLKALQQRIKSNETVNRLFKLCYVDGKYSEKIFSDLNHLLDKKIAINNVEKILNAAKYDNKEKYNSSMVKYVLDNNIKNKKTVWYDLLEQSKNKKGDIFSKNHFETLLRLYKKYGLNFYNIYTLNTFVSDKHTAETEKQITELKSLGLSNNDILMIFLSLGSCSSLEILNALTKNLPEFDNTQLAVKFIQNRIDSAKLSNGNDSVLDKDSFNLFNNLYKMIIDKKDKYSDSDLLHIPSRVNSFVTSYRDLNKKDKKQVYNFTVDALNYMKFEDIKDISFSLKFKKLSEIYNLMNADDKKDFRHFVYNIMYVDLENGFIEQFKKIYPYCKDKVSATSLYKIIDKCLNDKYLYPKLSNEVKDLRLNYAIKNIEVPEQKLMLLLSLIEEKEDYKAKIDLLESLLNNGFSLKELNYDKQTNSGFWNIDNGKYTNQNLNWVNNAIYLKNKGILSEHVNYILNSTNSISEIDKLLDIRNEAIKRRNFLQIPGENLTQTEIDDVFFMKPQFTLNTLKLLGKNTFVQMFAEGIDNVDDNILALGDLPDAHNSDINLKIQKSYQRLLEIVNPVESDKYKKLESEIKELKRLFSSISDDEEKSGVISKINQKTREKRLLLSDSIKEPKDILQTARVFFSLIFSNKDTNEYDEGLKYVEAILPYMNPKTPKERSLYNKKLADMVGSFYLYEPMSDELLKRLNLTENKYLAELFNPDDDFFETFSEFLHLIEENSHLTNLEIFNSLPQNIKTKELFEKYNLNYDNWVGFNPKSRISIEVKTDYENAKSTVLKNLEADFNDAVMNVIPETEKQKLYKALNKAGYMLKDTEVSTYSGNGDRLNTKNQLKLYKQNKQVEFDDLANIVAVLKTVLNVNEFWNTENNDEKIENAKNTFKNHILTLRYNEVKNALSKKSNNAKNITIQKADMNDISHSLFLGNDAACCTAIGTGCNMWTAPNYIKNKLISCIEVKDGDKSIGNTMMYVVIIDGKPALLLDNIELKIHYQYNDSIRDGIFDYAKVVAKELGHPRMPIYIGPNRHKVNVDCFPCKEENFNILGCSGKDYLYFDFDTDSLNINGNREYSSYLYRVR